MNAPRHLPSLLCLLFSFCVVVRREASGDAAAAAAAAADDFASKVNQAAEQVKKKQAAWTEHLRLFDDANDQTLRARGGFSCQTLPSSSRVPTSVHQLRPSDVRVVAALGDSLSTGFGALATRPEETAKEWRGRSWSVGGDSSIHEVTTLPNFLRMYNPNVVGYASQGSGEDFEVASAGASAADIPRQAAELVERIRSDRRVNFVEDWKLVTLFVGGADLCTYDSDKLPEHFFKSLQASLDTLRTMPRVFVNLVAPGDIPMSTSAMAKAAPVCRTFLTNECPYFASGKMENLAQGNWLRGEYGKMLDHLAGEFEAFDNFTVVRQPVFANAPPTTKNGDFKGTPDLSFFALDCFHLSAKANAAAATSLWNNLFSAPHEKRLHWTEEALVCPTPNDPYLKTAKNSKKTKDNEGDEWLEAKDLNDFDAYPASTGSAVTWGFIALLIGIAIVASVLYFLKTRQANRRDSERSGLLRFDDEDTVYDRRSRFGDDSIAMETVRTPVT